MAVSSRHSEPAGLFQYFFRSEISGSVILLACTVVALAWANSPWAASYFEIAHTYVGVSWGDSGFKLSLQHWINDALMVVFFFVVGLEIKREMSVGELSSFDKAVLPVSAALGGMVVPAIIYAAFNFGGPGASGWGVPMATDIAFAIGILAMFGKRAPLGLKVFLTALAIADDLGAVLVIALFYTAKINWLALGVAAVFLLLLLAANRAGLRRTELYLLMAVAVWVGVFASGVHATVAGVLVAMVIPVRASIEPEKFLKGAKARLQELEASGLTSVSMLKEDDQLHALDSLSHATQRMLPAGIVLEHYLHPLQSFLILPLFAFFNAGVTIDSGSVAGAFDPITLGVVLGLVVGKQLGVFGFSWLTVRSGRAALPAGVTWPQVWGASCLAGVGFTMSLFIAELAYGDAALVTSAKIGILAASLIAAVLGYAVLARVLPRR